ncbi:LLM class F420-dependent oxidoreductase [Paractinoplanes toevensis]|uniref:LLM class F420-dependent oxidoreductase n=1 Tax=Paractinoplanes toevensis TaxID=571911 RepID=A0A919TF80_9ACTN|nr:LLM class F420-dependent oxidoreductase [Actinoplanes toevensis]GIM93029.1 LLM class F420-dependent oxidoreductase [Actinoplanes toevensis]
MELGLAIADFTWPGGNARIGDTLHRLASSAEEAGFSRITVMDHLWQAPVVGAPEREMLEAYTTLGFLAAATQRVQLLTLVTATTYRDPGLLAKMITTLDVLSGGRAWLGIGIGAGFNVGEASGLGLPFPATAERFERLEETLRICHQMFRGDQSPFRGKHYSLGRTLNSPAPIRRPPILVAGSGERKTLRLVAQYADACNLFAGPDIERKLNILRRYCVEAGRDYDAIEKTVLLPLDPGPGGRGINRLLATLQYFADLGVDTVYGPVPGVHSPEVMELLRAHVIPATNEMGQRRDRSAKLG